MNKLTPRNWINIGVVVLAILSVVAQQYGVAPLSDYGFSASHARDIALAFSFGAFWPGSPVSHVLDYLAARLSGNKDATPPSDADLGSVRDMLSPTPPSMPVRITSAGGTVAPQLVRAALLVFLSGALAVGGAATFMHGCGGSQLRTQAAFADVTGATLDAACQEVDHARSAAEDGATFIDAGADVGTSAHDHYAAAVASCNLIADAHDAWTAELQRAASAKLAGEPYTLDITLAERVLASWPDVQVALDAAGVRLADPGKDLVSFVAVSGPATSALDAGVIGGSK